MNSAQSYPNSLLAFFVGHLPTRHESPMQSLLIQATGANAGGPVTCVGSNLIDSISQGIIQ